MRITPLFGLILPWIELLTGGFLIIGLFVKSSTSVILVLVCMFIISILAANLRGIDTECGCFKTSGGGKVGYDLLFRDLLLVFFLIQILIGHYSYLAIDNLLLNKKK